MSDSVTAGSRGSFASYFLPLVLCSAAIGAVALTMIGWFPPLASEHGGGIDTLLVYLLISTGSIMAIGHILLGWFVWNFSRQDKVTFRAASPRTEKWWLFGTMIVIGLIAEGGVLVLGLPVWDKVYGATEANANATLVEVTGEQFGWNVRYPGPDGVFGKTDPTLIAPSNKIGLVADDPASKDDIVLFNKFYLPVDKLARIRLRSKDVIHDFFLAHFRVKQDLVPGLTIETKFKPVKTGTYEIACAELCGMGHYQMRGILVIATQQEYDAWLSQQKPLLQPPSTTSAN